MPDVEPRQECIKTADYILTAIVGRCDSVARYSKKEYEELLNSIFGTGIKWSRLSLQELEELAQTLTDEEKRRALCEKLGCTKTRYLALDIIDALVPPEKQGPVLRKLRSMLEGTDIRALLQGGEQ